MEKHKRPTNHSQIMLSTVTPVFAGKDYLRKLVELFEEQAHRWEKSGIPLLLTECIFVDDGSSDGSAQLLAELANQYHFVTVVTLSRNFGQHPATVAGILHSCGDWVITIDEDLQHDPRFILVMLEQAVRSELDIVYAKPLEDVHESRIRDWGSKWFKSMLAILTGNPFVKDFNSFRVIRGSIARAAASVSSHATYLDASLCWFSQRIGVEEVSLKDSRYIELEQSAYSFRKLMSHARRMVITLQSNWLRLGTLTGIGAFLVSLVVGTGVLIQKLVAPNSIEVRGWVSLFIAILFFGGLTTSLLGVLIEYISMIVLHLQGKPNFFVVDRSNDRTLLAFFLQKGQTDVVTTSETT